LTQTVPGTGAASRWFRRFYENRRSQNAPRDKLCSSDANIAGKRLQEFGIVPHYTLDPAIATKSHYLPIVLAGKSGIPRTIPTCNRWRNIRAPGSRPPDLLPRQPHLVPPAEVPSHRELWAGNLCLMQTRNRDLAPSAGRNG